MIRQEYIRPHLKPDRSRAVTPAASTASCCPLGYGRYGDAMGCLQGPSTGCCSARLERWQERTCVQKTEVFHLNVRFRRGRAPLLDQQASHVVHSRIAAISRPERWEPARVRGESVRAPPQMVEATRSLPRDRKLHEVIALRRRPDGPDLAGAGSWTLGRETDTTLRLLIVGTERPAICVHFSDCERQEYRREAGRKGEALGYS
jgi:hypothetical protein